MATDKLRARSLGLLSSALIIGSLSLPTSTFSITLLVSLLSDLVFLFAKILGMEEKVRKLKTDLKRYQDKTKHADGEVSKLKLGLK